MSEKELYKLDDNILFRLCSLHEHGRETYGDCTNFSFKEIKWKDFYTCNQYGIHYHCATHPEI